MNARQVRLRTKLTENEFNSAEAIFRMAGEGVLVQKTEAAGALIYWDGKVFRW